MPMSASDYLSTADTLANSAMSAESPERESFYTAMSQATAIAAVAAAVVQLAEAVENLAAQGRA